MNFKSIITVSVLILTVFISCGKMNEPSDEGTPVVYETLQCKSSKRGVSYNFNSLPTEDIPLLGPAISWSYNWGMDVSMQAGDFFKDFSMDYCPMIWNNNWHEDNLRNLVSVYPNIQYLLAFNEPNLVDQANMTPQQAASYWPRVREIASELGLKLISPAMNFGTMPEYHDPVKWFDEFLAQPGVSIDDIDGIALHCYMGSANAVKGFLDSFKKYGKPLWLTEFCNWSHNNVSVDEQMKYMTETINMLEGYEQVERYAWFIPRGKGEYQCHNSLLTSKTPIELTELGYVFVNMSSQDKDLKYKVNQVIPAEHYSACKGDIHLARSSDATGILEVNDLKKTSSGCNSVEYQVQISEGGSSYLDIRLSTFYDTQLSISLDGTETTILEIPNTHNTWETVSQEVRLPQGVHTVTIIGVSAFPVNLNWLRIR